MITLTQKKVCQYDDEKVIELQQNKKIIRNKLKIKASINNSKIFKNIQKEFGSFNNYLKTFTDGKTYYEIDKTTSPISDAISKDLQKKRNEICRFNNNIFIFTGNRSDYIS